MDDENLCIEIPAWDECHEPEEFTRAREARRNEALRVGFEELVREWQSRRE